VYTLFWDTLYFVKISVSIGIGDQSNIGSWTNIGEKNWKYRYGFKNI